VADFVEVADRVWVARYEWFDVNVTLVGGERGLLMVDTHASEQAARAVVGDVRRLGAGEVVGVVNTHEHFDHTFGNIVLREEYGDLPIHAHEQAAERTVSAGERIKELYVGSDDPHTDEVRATRILPADHTLSSARSLDLGDRLVELVHPGRGHTGGDVVVRVPEADVVLAGDLVEESAMRDGVPGLGADSYPLDWPATLDLVLELVGPSTVVVPGHGAPVGRTFVHEQRTALGVVAETIRDLAARGVPVEEALTSAEWPYPRELLTDAVRRGYEQLPRSQKRLPLL
jgi:glyoxylase-like metal-dependent hydrolase (beta-lactamase superfamily II)